MRFTLFKTIKPKEFTYSPRFYDPHKEAREQRNAALGLDSTLSDEEKLRSRIRSRWHREKNDSFNDPYKRLSLFIYIAVVMAGLYFILFTDAIEIFLRAFGVGATH